MLKVRVASRAQAAEGIVRLDLVCAEGRDAFAQNVSPFGFRKCRSTSSARPVCSSGSRRRSRCAMFS